ncbi:DUF6879 family protein [Streptomyces paludis]|uniref:DUF6879 domain-containing protein n=1 Tax=Streptomyces paludis TaxID=2282738 RepID=A0A345HSK7_9ACTN|nr:DUF6879 family protein [Streptomyces paludis]AXG79681.1 hypothetical protein DVK44_20795 [Streptomyces paludis]
MRQSGQQPSFEELMAATTRAAVHLEMRDAYGVSDEADDFRHWRQTGERDVDPASAYWGPWVSLVKDTVRRGVEVRRVRIVSEPVSDYIRYEHAGTVVNTGAGENVRWLPRRQASALALPGNDFWLFDEETVLFNHFAGDGEVSPEGRELRTEPAVARLAARAFAAAWALATPHDHYRI